MGDLRRVLDFEGPLVRANVLVEAAPSIGEIKDKKGVERGLVKVSTSLKTVTRCKGGIVSHTTPMEDSIVGPQGRTCSPSKVDVESARTGCGVPCRLGNGPPPRVRETTWNRSLKISSACVYSLISKQAKLCYVL